MTFKEYSNTEIRHSGIPCGYGYIGCNMWGTSYPTKQLYSPSISGNMQTLNNITSLSPILLDSDDTPLSSTGPRTQMTSDYIFVCHYGSSWGRGRLSRYSTADYTEDIYDPWGSESRQLVRFEVYDNNTIYTIEFGTELEICRVTFDDVGGTSRTTLMSWAEEVNLGGTDYLYWDDFFFTRVKSDNVDAVVYCGSLISQASPSDPEYYFHVCIYHIDTDTTYSEYFAPSLDWSYADMYHTYWQCGSPATYNNYLIWTYTIGYLDLPSGPPYGNHAWIANLVIDISIDDISIKDNMKVDIDNGPYEYTYTTTGMVDYDTGIYYFTYYKQIYYGHPETDSFTLCQMPISEPFTISDVTDFTMNDWFTGWQSETIPYMVNMDNAPATEDVYYVPSLIHPDSVDLYCSSIYCACTVDVVNHMMWNVKSDRLQGIAVSGGTSDRDITIEWDGGTVPFTYSGNRQVLLQIFDGMAFIIVFSRQSSPTLYQTDFYLLKET